MIGVRIDSVSTVSGKLVIKYTSLLPGGEVVGGKGFEMEQDEYNELPLESTLGPDDLVKWMLQSVKNRTLSPTTLVNKKIVVDHESNPIVKIEAV